MGNDMTKAVTREELVSNVRERMNRIFDAGTKCHANPEWAAIRYTNEATYIDLAITAIIRERDEAYIAALNAAQIAKRIEVDLSELRDEEMSARTLADGLRQDRDALAKERDALQIDNKKLRMSDKDDMVAPCGCTEHFVAAGDASHFKPMDTSCKYPEVLADRDEWKKRAEEAEGLLLKHWEFDGEIDYYGRSTCIFCHKQSSVRETADQHAPGCIITRLSSEG